MLILKKDSGCLIYFLRQSINLCRVGFMLLLCLQAASANTNDRIQAFTEQALEQKASVTTESINRFQQQVLANSTSNQSLVKDILRQSASSLKAKKQGQAADGAVLFVSFSMPESLLLALADEASLFDIPLVINGLVDNDLQKTMQRFAALHKKAKKAALNFSGLSIDPLWFEQFKISSVPALVLTKRPADCQPQALCPGQDFDVVYGNASIKNSLKLIADKGEAAANVAKMMLEQGHV